MINDPNKVILHCAATPDEGDNFGAADIDLWHRQRGFDQIGYHFVVRRTGIVENGRPVSIIGAHCEGHNECSIGVCWVGTRWPTKEQLQAIVALHGQFWRLYGIRAKDWFGHREFDGEKKDCPGFPPELLRMLLTQKELVAPIL